MTPQIDNRFLARNAESAIRTIIALLLVMAVFACAPSIEDEKDSGGGDREEESEYYPPLDGDSDGEPAEIEMEEAEAEPEAEPEAEEEMEPESEEENFEWVEPEAEPWDFDLPPVETCVPGQRVCMANKLKICNDDGYGWTRILCEPDQICAFDGCYDVICGPGELKCMDGDLYTCNPEGTAFEISEVCRPPESCSDSACRPVCGEAEPITLDELVMGDTSGLANTLQVNNSCWTGAAGAETLGPDRLHKIHLERGRAIRIKVTPLTRHYDTAVYVFTDCGELPQGCLGGADACCSLTPDIYVFTAPESRDYFIAVDSWERMGGEYSIKVSNAEPNVSDLAVSGLRLTDNADGDAMTFVANVSNLGPMAARNLKVGAYLFDESLPDAGALPYRQLVYNEIAAGSGVEAAFRFPLPPNGNYKVWAVADWDNKIYDPDRANNWDGPLSFAFSEGVTEEELEYPVRVPGRIQFIGEERYYRLVCREGRFIAVELSSEPELSSLDPQVILYGPDDETTLQAVDEMGGSEGESFHFFCPYDGRLRLGVKAAATAPPIERTGSYELAVAPMSEMEVLPPAMNLFPGRSRQLDVFALLGDFDPEAVIPITESCSFISLDSAKAGVSGSGEVTAAGNISRATTFVIVTPSDPEAASVAVPIEISSYVPGEIYPTADPMPLTIPDASVAGILSAVNVPADITIEAVFLGISITHPNISHITVDLISPSGTELRLHGGEATGRNLVTVYGALVEPEGPGSLNDFIGEPAMGNWYLHIVDDDSANSGRLNTWRIYILAAGEE